MALTSEIRISATATQTASADLGTPTFYAELAKTFQWASGVTANSADLLFSDERTLAASATEDLDLAGVLTNAFGATVTMAEVVGIIVLADAANTNDVVLGAALAAVPLFGGTSGTHAVKPGGIFVAVAPNAAGLLTVGAGATDVLKVANSSSGTAVTYKIMVFGRSA